MKENKFRSTTNTSGYYVFPNLFCRQLQLFLAAGFKKSVQPGIELSAAARLNTDVELAAGAVTESVEVTGAATLVTTDSATVGRTVDTKQIEETSP